MKQFKRMTSWILTLSLLLSLFTFPGFAEETGTGSGTGGENSSESGSGGTGSESGGESGSQTPTPPAAVYLCEFSISSPRSIDPEETCTYTSGAVVKKDGVLMPDSAITQTWSTADSSIATITNAGVITGKTPGKTEVTVTVKVTDGDVVKTYTKSQTVTVSGIVLSKNTMELLENERAELPSYTLYGAAEGKAVTWSSSNAEVARTSRDIYVDAWSVGKTDLTAKVENSDYSARVSVTVKVNQANSISRIVYPGNTLSFASIETEIANNCLTMTGGSLSYVTGLSVSTGEGILFENYRSEDEPGKGVAQSGSYYVASSAVGPYLSDITFVPNAFYAGDTVTIQYGGVSSNKRSFTGRIVVTLVQADNDITLAATATSPAKFSGQMFSEVCQRATSSVLDYVTFSLPAGTRGTLYYDYVSDIDYDHKIDLGTEYPLSQLDDISFVPAPGFTGTVNIYYTGYTISGQRYTGEINISVTQSTEGGPVYNMGKGSMISFSETDFDNYCYSITGEDLDRVRFTLPNWDEGTLYYDYKSTSNTGTRVSTATTYYAHRNPRISRITFVPDAEFSGTVKIPFTGWDENNTSFNGVVEINVRSTGSGDVTYTCYRGGYVRFDRSDFNKLSEELTSRSLSYNTFQTLPGSGSGTLYTGKYTTNTTGSRVTRGTKYYSGELSNMSFWAGSDFNGDVEILFTGVASGGDSFTGILRINGQERWDEDIYYTTVADELVTFDADDFDDIAWDATGQSLRYVRFTLPSQNEGVLYYDYKNSNSSKVTANRSYYFNSYPYLDKVGFLPDEDFSGMVRIPFTAYTSTDDFYGVVEVYVQAGEYKNTNVTYTTTYAPILLSASRFEEVNSSSSSVVSVSFGDMPKSSEGYIYYQYSGPNQYSWKASAGTEYKVNGSPRLESLSFVPRADFQGRITLPYTATRANGSKFSGDVVIYVEGSSYSRYFNDMSGYSNTARAAVDYLCESGVVSGKSATEFGPAEPIQRGDFALMLCKAFNLYAPSNSKDTFRDVPNDAYYAKAVNTLRYLGIVSGSGNNMYQPNALLTRQDAMLMVQKALLAVGWSSRSVDENILYDYEDGAKVATYARQAMAYIVGKNLLPVSGYRLAPQENLTRVDMAQVLYRALTY